MPRILRSLLVERTSCSVHGQFAAKDQGCALDSVAAQPQPRTLQKGDDLGQMAL